MTFGESWRIAHISQMLRICEIILCASLTNKKDRITAESLSEQQHEPRRYQKDRITARTTARTTALPKGSRNGPNNRTNHGATKRIA